MTPKPMEVDSFIQSQGFNGKAGPELTLLILGLVFLKITPWRPCITFIWLKTG